MRLSRTYSMKLKRRVEGKTDYKKRLALIKSRKPRLVARVKNKEVIAQVIEYQQKGDNIKANANSTELKKIGWDKHPGNSSSAYLTGYMCGKRAIENGIKECNLDIGLHTPVNGSNVFAVLQGAIEAGLKIPHNEKCFPKNLDTDAIEKIKPKIKPTKKKPATKKKTTKKASPKKKASKKKGDKK